jgi:hypothetical protein
VGFLGVAGTGSVGVGGSGAGGAFISNEGAGVYGRGAAIVGGDVGLALEFGYSQSLSAFRHGSRGACLGGGFGLSVGVCYGANSSGRTFSGSVGPNLRTFAYPIGMHVEQSYTFAPTFGGIASAMQGQWYTFTAGASNFYRGYLGSRIR